MERREFLKTAAMLTVAGTLLNETPVFAQEYSTKLKKAMICGYPTEDGLMNFKRNNFQGVESTDWSCGREKAEAARVVADKVGMEIHSVMRAWTNVNNDAAFDADVESVERALETAAGYGANAVLWVPCRTGGAMPKPREFKIEFDPETLMVSKVVAGDNAPYESYIKAQNYATERSIVAIRRLIAAAEKNGVVIGIENVWNNLWNTPDFFAAFVKSFDSPWVQGYFDIGNHVKYANPEEYIYAFGKGHIIKFHAKDFLFDPAHPDGGGFGGFKALREGSVNWPSVRKAIDDIGYNGYLTIEGPGTSEALDLIIAGK